VKEFLKKRIVTPLVALLKQGITPEKLALSLAFGICLGVFPVLGSTTILCSLAAILFRLNLPAINLINWFVYPLQIALIMPFIRMGEKILGAAPIPYTLTQMVAMLHTDMWATITALWQTTVHAIFAWFVVGPLMIVILYKILTPLMRRIAKMNHTLLHANASANTGEERLP
jgi:uncharacterized protein (DUF2062 family)